MHSVVFRCFCRVFAESPIDCCRWISFTFGATQPNPNANNPQTGTFHSFIDWTVDNCPLQQMLITFCNEKFTEILCFVFLTDFLQLRGRKQFVECHQNWRIQWTNGSDAVSFITLSSVSAFEVLLIIVHSKMKWQYFEDECVWARNQSTK